MGPRRTREVLAPPPPRPLRTRAGPQQPARLPQDPAIVPRYGYRRKHTKTLSTILDGKPHVGPIRRKSGSYRPAVRVCENIHAVCIKISPKLPNEFNVSSKGLASSPNHAVPVLARTFSTPLPGQFGGAESA